MTVFSLGSGETLVVRTLCPCDPTKHTSHDADPSMYRGGIIPTLPLEGPFKWESFAGPDITFDPWPEGDWSTVGHPGYFGFEWGMGCAMAVVNQYMHPRGTWQVVITDRTQLAFDHGRTTGKCRFASGEVIYTGDMDGALVLLEKHWPADRPKPVWNFPVEPTSQERRDVVIKRHSERDAWFAEFRKLAGPQPIIPRAALGVR